MDSFESILPVFRLSKIKVLSIHGNPFLNSLNYIIFIKTIMPNLEVLDEKDLSRIGE